MSSVTRGVPDRAGTQVHVLWLQDHCGGREEGKEGRQKGPLFWPTPQTRPKCSEVCGASA